MTIAQISGPSFRAMAVKFRKAAKSIDTVQDRTIHGVLKDGKKELEGAILGQSTKIRVETRALTADYAARKTAAGLRSNNLAATGTYGNRVVVLKRRGKARYYFGARSTRYPGKKITYAALAKYLEQGTRRMEPIPHWTPARKWIQKEVGTRLKREIARAL